MAYPATGDAVTKILSKDRLQGFSLNMTQRCFGEPGIPDAEVPGYVADVLTEFARRYSAASAWSHRALG